MAWLAGWPDTLAAGFVIAGLLFYLRDTDVPSVRLRFLSLVLFAAGACSKETGFVFPLLLPLVDWLRQVPLRKDLGRLSLFWLTALVLFVWRWHVLGGLGGYADVATGKSEMLSLGWLVPVKVLLLRIWGPLFYPLNWSVEPGLAGALSLAVAVVAYFALARASDGRRKILFALALTLVCSLPALSQLLIGADMEKSRGLYLPSVGFCLLLGVLARGRFRIMLLLVVAAFQLLALEHNLAIWANASDLMRAVSRDAATKIPKTAEVVTVVGAPRTVDGVYFLQNCAYPCLERGLRRKLNWVCQEPGNPEPCPTRNVFVLNWDKRTRRLAPGIGGEPPE